MKKWLFLGMFVLIQTVFTRPVLAGDFEWLNDLHVKAEADSSGFRLSLASRFHIGDLEINAVLGHVERGADAYMIFRLAELSHRSTHDVINIYQSHKHHGWGKMAKELGIKPGSAEFHQLKNGHDLKSENDHSKGKKHKKNKKPKKDKG